VIEERFVRQYAHQSAVDFAIALQEIVLTYALAHLHDDPAASRMAFKGGTALRKLVFGSDGRFSVDLDFLANELSDDDLMSLLERLDGGAFHGVRFAVDEHRFTDTAPDEHGMQPPPGMAVECSFTCDIGRGDFGLDLSRRRESLLPVREVDLLAEPYFARLEFQPPRIRALAIEEAVAEKISACARRITNGSGKDVYDLFLYLSRPHNQELIRRLTVLTFWLDRRTTTIAELRMQIVPEHVRWEELGGLLGRRQLDRSQICQTVAERLAFLEQGTSDERRLFEDAGSHRFVAEWIGLRDQTRGGWAPS
jgi:predicted nucleotidyltransferase component of viral defense system